MLFGGGRGDMNERAGQLMAERLDEQMDSGRIRPSINI